MTIRVLLADDQHLVRAGFRGLLEHSGDIEVVGEAADGATAVRMTRATSPDVVLMDVRMPGMDGIDATRRIVALHPDVRVVVLTTFELDEYVAGALRAGASGFLGKDVEPDALRDAIRVVAAGEALLSPRVTRQLIRQFVARVPSSPPEDGARLSVLTEREREVMVLAAEGLSNDDIGRRLYLSPATVRTHLGRAMAKLGLHDRAQLVVLAYRSGLVRP
ncbi:MAG: response regulator transcription factor [Streptosporangiales bacterium]|nr:response regulator transcription factor [Streptosporangiales bacterium]MBO0892381.1 response regulator transcription factor [Acidothermales bacterium]